MPLTAEEIEAKLNQPAAASNDSGSATNRSADDIIKLDSYAAAKANPTNASRGIRFSKITFGSNVGGNFGGET